MTDPDHPVLIDTIILNQANDFSAYFEDLLLEAGNQKINYQLRERNHQDYQTSYDFRNIETNTSGVYEIDQQQDAHLEIYNEPKPDEPIPEDPTPEDPTPENPMPEDPTPENPTPEDPMPEKPFEPNLPEIPETEEPIKVEQMQVIGQLPETGEQDSTIWLGVAGLSILAGTAILIINKEDESI